VGILARYASPVSRGVPGHLRYGFMYPRPGINKELMSRYFYLHVVRRVPDPSKDNFFITGAPHNNGVHSSYMDMLFERTEIDPALSPKPDWYRNTFSSIGGQEVAFFEPAEVIRDLERILAEILRRNAQLPVYHWLLIGNIAGVREVTQWGRFPSTTKMHRATLARTGMGFTSGVPKGRYVRSPE